MFDFSYILYFAKKSSRIWNSEEIFITTFYYLPSNSDS